jgi:phosphatidylglycerol---prolipoprotein diacylglyceryl transferase
VSFPVPLAAAFLLLEVRFPWIDPVALPLPGPIDIRWYGLAYLFSFALAYVILRWLSREQFLRLEQEAVGDLIFALILGTILGGRLGYILFYDFPAFAAEPQRILRIWEGGLSFHGGLIGVLLSTAWFARGHRLSFLHVTDALALVIPFGLLFGRLANFINGELFGRVASPDVPWGMRFPTDPVALRLLNADRLGLRERELAIEQAYETGYWDSIRDQVPLRHPSQLYEALLEGLLLGLILWGVFWISRRRGRQFAEGLLGGIFLVGYGIFRSFVEIFRQPDAQFRGPDDPVGTVLGPLTMGQTLSLFVILGGIILLVLAWRDRGARPGGARTAVKN